MTNKELLATLKILRFFEENEIRPLQDELNKAAVGVEELINKTTPKKPFTTYLYANGHEPIPRWECSRCGRQYDHTIPFGEYDYCPNCGQKLDWSEMDE